MVEVKEGITPRLENNNWFQENIRPRVKKAVYIEAPDNFHYQIVKTENEATGKVAILVVKVAHTGYMKSTFNMTPAVAKEVARILQEMVE